MKDEIIELTKRAFWREMEAPPPMPLRAGNALDDYEEPPVFDPQVDVPTEAYLEAFYWGLPYLDSQSWRYYLSFFIEYAVHHISDSKTMAVDALLSSLRPPDREPPRFKALSQQQREAVIAVLDMLAFCDESVWKEQAIVALEEYWGPGAIYGESNEEENT
jgi:hypothetical protein